MITETATVRPQPFYQADVYAEGLDYTVVDDAAPLDSLAAALTSAARAAWTSVAAMAVAGCITITPGQLLPSAYTEAPRVSVGTEAAIRARSENLRALSERLHARATLVSSAFTRVPLSAVERTEDPDHGF